MKQSRLQKKYKEEIQGKLKEEFKFSNVMLVPELKKIVVNMGVAETAKDKNALAQVIKELALITGQKPLPCQSTKSISNFKLREGQTIGLKVTLRGKRMYDFFDRFTNIVSPRIRDFRGFNTKGDGQGNYTLGINDQQIYPELDLDAVIRIQGMHITFVTSAKREEECMSLLKHLGMPFKIDKK